MKKVLIISYYAPPVGMSGVMRVTKFAKYLPKFNWQPFILTTKPIAYYHYDDELLNDLKEVKIFRSESLDFARILRLLRMPRSAIKAGTGKLSLLSNFIFFPDAKYPWFPFAYRLGCKVIEQTKPDIIWATAPPFTSLMVGLALKQKFQIPLISDFRDPWPTGFIVPPNSHRKRLEILRDNIISKSDMITVVNKVTAEKMNFQKAQVIENGFDPADFTLPAANLRGFNIVYTGSAWENFAEIKLVAEAISNINDIKLILLGKCDASGIAQLNKYPNIKYLGTRPHSETISTMKSASLLLYVSRPNQIVGIKLYEYFGAGKPVLGICNECNEAMRLIEHHSVGLTVACNKEEIRQAVLLAKGNKFPYNPTGLDHYDRINQAQKLSEILNNLTKPN